MKLLNEHGWGLGVMFVFIIVFILAIIIIAIQADQYGIGDVGFLFSSFLNLIL